MILLVVSLILRLLLPRSERRNTRNKVVAKIRLKRANAAVADLAMVEE